MKKPTIWSRIGNFLMGKGFYMVLLLCVMAIGGSGYYLYHLATEDLTGQTVSATAEVEIPAEEASGEVSAEEVAGAIAEAEERAQALAEAETEAQTDAASEGAQTESSDEAAAEDSAAETASEEVSAETAAAEEPSEEVSTETPAEETAAVTETEETAAVTEAEEAAAVTEEPAEEAASFAPPVQGEVVAAFSDSELTYNAALGDWRTHNGVDLAANAGDAVCAVLDGEVLSVTEDVLLGTTITLNHGDGLTTVYGNLDPDVAVEQGDAVSAGEVIGAVGETAAGETNEGAWLHFAVSQDGEAVDPSDYLG